MTSDNTHEITAQEAASFYGQSVSGADAPAEVTPEGSDPSETKTGNAPEDDAADKTPSKANEGQQESGDSEGHSTEEDGKSKPDATPKPSRSSRRAERRIQKLSQAQQEKDEEIARLREERDNLRSKVSGSAESTEPSSDDFDTVEEYAQALADWKVEKQLSARTPSEEDEGKQGVQTYNETTIAVAEQHGLEPAEVEEIRLDFLDVVADGKDKYSDFLEVTNKADLSFLMAQELADIDNGEDVFYHLGKNPKLAEKLSQITDPRQLSREIAKIDMGGSAEPEKAPVEPKVKRSKASEPAPEISSSGGGGTSVDDQSMDEYAKGYFKRAGQ